MYIHLYICLCIYIYKRIKYEYKKNNNNNNSFIIIIRKYEPVFAGWIFRSRDYQYRAPEYNIGNTCIFSRTPVRVSRLPLIENNNNNTRLRVSVSLPQDYDGVGIIISRVIPIVYSPLEHCSWLVYVCIKRNLTRRCRGKTQWLKGISRTCVRYFRRIGNKIKKKEYNICIDSNNISVFIR